MKPCLHAMANHATRKKGMQIKETLNVVLALVLERNNFNVTIWRAYSLAGAFPKSRRRHVIHQNILVHQRWSYLDGARLRSRKYLCLAYLARDASPLSWCVSCVSISIRMSSAVCISPTVPCHVTYNLMAFFPVIRSSRRKTHFLFLLCFRYTRFF